MFEGWLGEPFYGMDPDKALDSRKQWDALAEVIVGSEGKKISGRPGEHAGKVNLLEVRNTLEHQLRRKPSEDEVWSYLMYPEVFLKYADFHREFGDVSSLPTPAYFYGLQEQEEISVDLEEGKTLFIHFFNLTEPDLGGIRTAIFDLNGYPRHTHVTDRERAKEAKTHPKADPSDNKQVGAPMPGMVASIAVTPGQKVREGETLLTLEAMKMFAAVASPVSGTVTEILTKVGQHVESKDLLVRLDT